MNSPLITVIIPCYKVERYLPRCLDSIVRQTYSNLEVILVDDGSPDQSGQICESYAVRDKRFKVIHKLNGGLSDARNVAIDSATGDYLIFVDSDDYVAPDYVELLYRMVEKHNCKMAISSFRTFHENEKIEPIWTACVEKVMTAEEAVDNMFYQQDIETTAWGKIYHRSLFGNHIRFPKGVLFEDLPTVYCLMLACDKIACSNASTYYYLQRLDSIEGSAFNPMKMDSAMVIFQMMEQHKALIERVKRSYYCRMVSFSFHILLMAPKGYPKSEILIDFIKKHRLSVITDRKARKKARVACLFSYFGMPAVKRLFELKINK